MLMDGPMTAADPLPDARPYTLAAAFLRSHEFAIVRSADDSRGVHIFTGVTPTTLRHWREDFYRYSACVFERVQIEELTADVTAFLNNATHFAGKDNAVRPLAVTRRLVGDVVAQLRALCQARVPRMPAWLTSEGRPDADTVIAFRNGLLAIDNWLEDTGCELLKPSHLWFSEAVLPYDWQPTATCPRWEAFLAETLGNDADLIGLLQEFFGYCLTSSTRHQKFLWLHGVSGAGKSTVANVLRNVVGERNCVSFELWDLVERFSLSGWVGKRVAIAADASIGNNGQADKILSKIKGITGEDPQFIDRKNKDPITDKLLTRLVISTNEFPRLPDGADALSRRAIFIPFTKTFRGKADIGLSDVLRWETPGITAWALRGLARLLERGGFPDAEASKAMMEEYRRQNSPIHAFIEECLDVLTEEEIAGGKCEGWVIEKDTVYKAYLKWCAANRVKELYIADKPVFCKRLTTADHRIKSCRPREDGSRVYMFANCYLKTEWR